MVSVCLFPHTSPFYQSWSMEQSFANRTSSAISPFMQLPSQVLWKHWKWPWKPVRQKEWSATQNWECWQYWNHFYKAIQHIKIDIWLKSSPQPSFSRKMHVSLCTQARCHMLTVCLSIVGGLFGKSCVVEGRLSQSTKCLGNICDCLTGELRGMHIL